MKAKWYENLRTILKNSEKDADFLRRVSFWSVRVIRGKTQVTEKLIIQINSLFKKLIDVIERTEIKSKQTLK